MCNPSEYKLCLLWHNKQYCLLHDRQHTKILQIYLFILHRTCGCDHVSVKRIWKIAIAFPYILCANDPKIMTKRFFLPKMKYTKKQSQYTYKIGTYSKNTAKKINRKYSPVYMLFVHHKNASYIENSANVLCLHPIEINNANDGIEWEKKQREFSIKLSHIIKVHLNKIFEFLSREYEMNIVFLSSFLLWMCDCM